MKKKTFILALILCIVTGLIMTTRIIVNRPQPVINCNHPNRAYAFDVTDDSVFIYTKDDKFVGGIKLQGQLDSLVFADNE
jgi:hypothetical protein